MSSKRFKKLPEKTSELSAETIDKLLSVVKKNCTTKFDESVDLSFQINNKQKKSEINIRTVVNLPGGTGKKVKVAVVCEEAKASDAKAAGADITDAASRCPAIPGISESHVTYIARTPPATVAKPPTITTMSSELVIFDIYGRITKGASVCPTKMFEATLSVSGPLVFIVFCIILTKQRGSNAKFRLYKQCISL